MIGHYSMTNRAGNFQAFWMVLFCISWRVWATATFFSTSWDNIEVLPSLKYGKSPLERHPSVHFRAGPQTVSTHWWWQYSTPKYGKLPVRRSSISPFQWDFRLPWCLVHVIIYICTISWYLYCTYFVYMKSPAIIVFLCGLTSFKIVLM